jgi:hypothetical protein
MLDVRLDVGHHVLLAQVLGPSDLPRLLKLKRLLSRIGNSPFFCEKRCGACCACGVLRWPARALLDAIARRGTCSLLFPFPAFLATSNTSQTQRVSKHGDHTQAAGARQEGRRQEGTGERFFPRRDGSDGGKKRICLVWRTWVASTASMWRKWCEDGRHRELTIVFRLESCAVSASGMCCDAGDANGQLRRATGRSWRRR